MYRIKSVQEQHDNVTYSATRMNIWAHSYLSNIHMMLGKLVTGGEAFWLRRDASLSPNMMPSGTKFLRLAKKTAGGRMNEDGTKAQ